MGEVEGNVADYVCVVEPVGDASDVELCGYCVTRCSI